MNLRSRNKVNPSFNMSSMTDIVFLLLIFFIILSTMVSNAIKADLPEALGSSVVKSSISVTVKEDGTLYVNKEQVQEAELEDKIKVLMEQKIKNKKQSVILRAEPKVHHETAMRIYSMGLRNNWSMVFAVKKPKE